MPIVTPLALSGELGVPEVKILGFLKRYFNVAKGMAYSQSLSEEQLAAVRNKFSDLGSTGLPWLIAVGETRPRREVHGLYGGQEQGGISGSPD